MNPLRALIVRGRRRALRIYYDEAYRLPLTANEGAGASLEGRRSDDALHYLLREHAVDPAHVVNPPLASYEELALVHAPAYLESLHEPATLANIFAVDESEVFVDQLFRALRLAVGGTIAAARWTLAHRRPAMNLLGGFHHAAPARGGGFCALNDMAIALAQLRREGFTGRAAVLDFDYHPSDGTSECLGRDPRVWLGSVSGTSWGDLEGVDETVLPDGAGDEPYLEAVRKLLSRMPRVDLAFVLAGGDVLAGDWLGTLKLSLIGTRRRDLLVAERLGSLPQVWLPAGGYSHHAWKVVAGTGLVLALGSEEPIPPDYDPLAARMRGIMRTLRTESLGDDSAFLSDADVAEALGMPRAGPHRLAGYYTAEGVEYALERYRLLPLLRRLGFDNLHATIDKQGQYDRARLHGRDTTTGREHVLIELEVERLRLGQGTYLFVNWLSLRNPRAKFSTFRPQLPGQEVPGLGLAREMAQILGLMARRLLLDGVAFRPSWYHMAYAARHTGRFLDSARQGRFLALVRDSRDRPLLEVTRAVAEGRVTLNGAPYAWEAEEMVSNLHPEADPKDEAEVAAELERCRFSVGQG